MPEPLAIHGGPATIGATGRTALDGATASENTPDAPIRADVGAGAAQAPSRENVSGSDTLIDGPPRRRNEARRFDQTDPASRADPPRAHDILRCLGDADGCGLRPGRGSGPEMV
ncbi:MAG: hypothetical protein AAF334_02835 [Pseudomonadota bacterium]